MGGLPRRATVIEEQRSSGAPTLVVDAGDLFWKSARIGPDAVASQKLKAEAQAASFALTGIDAMVPGEGDLVFGWSWLQETASRHKLPYLAANLSCGDTAPFPPGAIFERGGLKIAVVGVVDPTLELPGCTVAPAEVAARGAIEKLGPADVTVVLSHQRTELDRALAEAIEPVDLIVNGHARLTNNAPRDLPGAALQLAAGSRSKYVGVASVSMLPGARGFRAGDAVADTATRLDQARVRLEAAKAKLGSSEGKALERVQRQVEHYQTSITELEAQLAAATEAQKSPANLLENRLVGLDDKVADHAATAALLAELKVQITVVESAEATATDASQLAYTGAESCRGCHPAPYAQWKATPHAKAYASLQRTSNHLDRACYACHTTGAEQPGGPATPAQASGLANVQCESCHGPGREHIATPKAGQMVRAPTTELCTGCHDGERDEGRFEPERYHAAVVHEDQPAAPGAPSAN